MDAALPKYGEWPIDPQEDQPIEDDKIWIDGCFDFFHHGHAGVMLQARQLGRELWVGIHSDEDILEHKGPTVMNLKERQVSTNVAPTTASLIHVCSISAADACRWSTKAVPHAPYVTDLQWISHYGCKYVVHGDDITSDSQGEDTYRFVKQAGRFKVVKRTPGISTTDLVGRMLLCTKHHFIRSLKDTLEGREGLGTDEERQESAAAMVKRIRDYASDASGLAPGVDVYMYHEPTAAAEPNFEQFVKGKGPMPGQRIVYVDGGFDLFSSGHIEFLRSVVRLEGEKAKRTGSQATLKYSPCYVVAGIHNDLVINREKGLNYPIMNIFERGLCLLQCKYVDSVVFGAPFEPLELFLRNLPTGLPCVVYHGPTSFMGLEYDPYREAKRLDLFEEVPHHEFQDVDAGHIVNRITASRERFEARQRAKGVKAVGEEAIRKKELESTPSSG